MTFTEPASAPPGPLAPLPDRLRLAVSAYLARFKGSSREHTESDLRCYLAWCAERGLDPLPPAVGRATDQATGLRNRGPVLLTSRGRFCFCVGPDGGQVGFLCVGVRIARLAAIAAASGSPPPFQGISVHAWPLPSVTPAATSR
jgi:hypothetical protein